MSDQVRVSSFEAVAAFRAALIGFIEASSAALSAAESDIRRTLTWLETEQVPHWKKVVREAGQQVEQAKTAYREKALYKDATGARHTAIDELRALRKAEARRDEAERRAQATRRNLRELQRDLTVYQGGIQRFRNMLTGQLPLAAEELTRVIEQLERYVHASPELPAPPAAMIGREETLAPELLRGPAAVADPEALADAALGRRTPSRHVRAAAPSSESTPVLPQVDRTTLDALAHDLPEVRPGRYELITLALPKNHRPDDELYLERCPPTGASDTGWHLGSAAREEEPAVCVTMTVGRIASASDGLAHLLALPTGTLLRFSGGRLSRVVDPLQRTLWRAASDNDGAGER